MKKQQKAKIKKFNHQKKYNNNNKIKLKILLNKIQQFKNK